jgi:hypothetical protein
MVTVKPRRTFTKQDENVLRQHGVRVELSSPGDGVLRYSFVRNNGRELFVAFGRHEAAVWLAGFLSGRE